MKKPIYFSPFKVLILFAIVTVLGVFMIPKLSVRLNPSESLPSINVRYSWENASPYAVEREITSVLESGFSVLKSISSIESKSSKGKGSISLKLDKHSDIDVLRFEIATVIRQLYKNLPEKVSYPNISLNRPNESAANRAFLSYSINASESPFEIQETVKTRIEPLIGAINGVDKTRVFGASEKEYVISYSQGVLAQLELSRQDIIDAIENVLKRESLGSISVRKEYISLVIESGDQTDWHIPVKKIDDRIIYLDDVATIKEQEQESKSYYRVNGKNSITLSIYAENNANTIVLADIIDEDLIRLKENLPNNYSIVQTYNSTLYLKDELSKIYERTAYTIIILLLFIFISSLSFKYLMVTILSLAANIGTAFLLYYLFQVEIQLYSLAGITISLGLIIDNSIVMIDHIKKQGNRNVFIPILASTLTTVGALTIIYFLDDKYKVNLIDFALVIIINLSISLFIAILLVPALLSKIKVTNKSSSYKLQNRLLILYGKQLSFLLRFKKIAIALIIFIFGLPFFMLPETIENNDTFFEKAYNKTLGNEWYLENVRPHIDKYLGGTFRLFNFYVYNDSYYSSNQETKLVVRASMEKGATIDQMNVLFVELEDYLKQFPQIKKFTTNVFGSDNASLEIFFEDKYESTSFPFDLKSRLIRKSLSLGGVDWSIVGVGNGFSNGTGSGDIINFTVKGRGYNYDDLNHWANLLKYNLEKHPRIKEAIVKENSYWSGKPSYEYVFSLDKERLAIKKRNPMRVYQELKSLALSKQSEVSLKVNGKYSPIRLESKNSKNFDVWNIQNTPLDSLENPLILKDLATISKEREAENIYKENQEYIRLVEFQYAGSAKFGSKFLNKTLSEFAPQLPIGYTFERSDGQWFFNDDKNTNYTFLLFLVLLIIYFICAILFESFKQPFIILSIIPISFIGVFLTFYLFNFNFDQGGLASFILLSGITVNASIFIINGFNKLKKQNPHTSRITLYTQAFENKAFPISLTILSTILGFIPFIKDGQNEVFWFALGVGTIGGLLFSMVGILFYLPLFTLKRDHWNH